MNCYTPRAKSDYRNTHPLQRFITKIGKKTWLELANVYCIIRLY